MDPRKQQLLGLIVEQYIATAMPVGSKFLSSESPLGVSAATIRNEMRSLEEEGYLAQPHTSAGRIPTQLGYRHFVDHILRPKKVTKKIQDVFSHIAEQENDTRVRLKTLSKMVSDHVGSAVIVSFDRDSMYYTGIGNLFAQPEFKNYQHTVNISSLFDRCEEVIDSVYEKVEKGPTVFIGEENPFGNVCSLVCVPFGNAGMMSVLGPMRMQYGKIMQILNHVHTLV